MLQHSRKVCRVSWSALGTWLASVTEDSYVHLWRPNLGGEWQLQSKISPAEPEEPNQPDSDFVMVD